MQIKRSLLWAVNDFKMHTELLVLVAKIPVGGNRAPLSMASIMHDRDDDGATVNHRDSVTVCDTVAPLSRRGRMFLNNNHGLSPEVLQNITVNNAEADLPCKAWTACVINRHPSVTGCHDHE